MWCFIRKDLLQLQLFGSVAMDSCLEYTMFYHHVHVTQKFPHGNGKSTSLTHLTISLFFDNIKTD